jgi:hypothetical protein
MRRLALTLLLAGVAAPAFAQDPQPANPQPPSATAVQAERADPSIDASKMGVSLSAIKKGLRTAEDREQAGRDGMRLQFQVQVYGEAPKIQVLQGVDLFNGAVPGSSPTHNQMIEFWTPVIYRTPGLPVSTLAFWAAEQIWKKSKKSQCEEEIANYRALVMQGVNVSAPTCSR